MKHYTDAEIREALVEWVKAEELADYTNASDADVMCYERKVNTLRRIARSLRWEQKATEAGKGKG